MRTKLILFFAFLLLVSSSAFSQSEKKDYFDFDSNGNLLTFKKTAPDGSWVEMGDKVKGSKYHYLTVSFANGDMLNSFYNCDDWNETVEAAYTGFFEKAQSFSDFPTFMKEFAAARKQPHPYGPGMGYIKNYDDDKTYSVLVKADGTKLRYYTSLDDIFVNECVFPINEAGDYIKCGLNDRKYKDLVVTDLGTTISYALMAVRKTYDDCVLELNLTDRWGNKTSSGSIEYNDKSSYSGTFIFGEGNSFYDWQYWRDSKEFPDNLKYKDGTLTTKDKKYKAYANGEYSEFQTAKVTQSLEKKAAEEKAEAEAIKQAKAILIKKYGEKYVNAMLKGNLILGTPEGLFVLGVQVNAYPTITKASCYYTNGNTSLYDVYGWRIDPNRTVAMTNVAYLGILRFENGVLVSIYK